MGIGEQALEVSQDRDVRRAQPDPDMPEDGGLAHPPLTVEDDRAFLEGVPEEFLQAAENLIPADEQAARLWSERRATGGTPDGWPFGGRR